MPISSFYFIYSLPLQLRPIKYQRQFIFLIRKLRTIKLSNKPQLKLGHLLRYMHTNDTFTWKLNLFALMDIPKYSYGFGFLVSFINIRMINLIVLLSCKIEMSYKTLYIILLYSGSEQEELHYRYQLTVIHGKSEYTYKGPVTSLVKSCNDVKNDGRCLVIRERVWDYMSYKLKITKH